MEEVFPRGGSVKKSTVKHQHEDEDDLFKVTEEAANKGKKRKFKKVEKKTLKKQKVHVPDFLQGIEPLSFKALYPEMLCLGCVKEVRQYELIVGLPNGLTGTVAITKISDTYTQALRDYASQAAADEQQEDIHGLHNLFKVGMLMLCKVLEPEPDHKGMKKKTRLTINPKDVHKNLSVKSIRNGMALFGVISSVEDHGYTVDIGVKGLQAFLKNKDAERYIQMHNDGYPLKAGQYVRCQILGEDNRMEILSGECRTVSVTINPKEVGKAQLNSSGVEVGFNSLIPGTRITVSIEKTSDEGIFVRFATFRGQIHRSHLTNDPNNYSQNKELQIQVVASVLYIHPLTKVISLTLLPHLVNCDGVALDLFQGLSFGDIIEAKLKHFDGNNRAFFQLTESAVGYANKKNLSDSNVKDIKKEFQRGSCYRCRVMGFIPMENVVSVTLKKSIVEQKYLRLADIKPGDLMECTIKALHNKGVSVKVGKSITGFIPTMHLTDVTLKNPEKKFKENDKLKCRVLFVNTQKNNLTLTHKKSLVHTKYPIITDYSQCHPGQELEGFILAIMDKGVRVNFFNDVSGFVPRSHLSSEPIPYPEKVFYRGQIVRCRVLSVSPAEQKLRLTFKFSSKVPFGQKKADVPNDFQIGKLVDCVVTQKGKEGFDVELQPSGKKAFLPKTHLSDSMAMCELLWDMHQEGTKIPQVMYYNKTSIIIVSAKQSFIKASKSNELFPGLSDLEPGMMYHGVVKNLMPYGVFVEFPGGMYCLAPNKFAVDRRVPDLSRVYTPGQTVVAKVTDVDLENKKFLVSLRMQDCYHGDTSIGLGLLRDYLQQIQAVIQKCRKKKNVKGRVAENSPGSIVKVRIRENTEEGLVCQLENGVRGLIPKDHVEHGFLDLEKDLECLVLTNDLVKLQVELSMKKALISKVKSLKESCSTKVKEGQGFKSEVLVIKEDFVLVMLRGHGAGQLAYLPSRRHLDDVLERYQFEVGQVNPLIIKEINGDLMLASLKIHEEKEADDDVIIRGRHEIEARNVKIGDIVTAKVKSVLPGQMNITIDKIPSRVHITQSVDEIRNGFNPFKNYCGKMEIQVRVIGMTEIKTSKYLPCTHPRFKKTLPECTLKPSLLAAKGDNFETEKKKLSVGEEVIAFVENYSGNFLWMHVTTNIKGKVHFFDVSNDLKVLENPRIYFKQGNGYNATVMHVIDDSLVQLTLTGSNSEVKEGCITKGKIVGVKEDLGLTLLLPHSYKGFASLTDLQDEFTDSPAKMYREGQVVKCCVVTMTTGNRCRVSLRKSRLKSGKTDSTGVKDPDLQSYSQLSLGQVLRGYITQKLPDRLIVSVGHEVAGFVKCRDSKEDYYPGRVVSVKIMSISEEKPVVKMSLLGHDIEERKDKKKTAQDKNKTAKGKRKSLLSESACTVDAKKSKKDESRESAVAKHTEISKKVGKSLSSGVNTSDIDGGVDIKKVGKSLSSAVNTSDTDSGVDIKKESDSEEDTKKPAIHLSDPPRLQLPATFSWDADFKLKEIPSSQGKRTIDDSDEEEIQEAPKKTKEQIRLEKLEEEKRLFEFERQQLEGEQVPQTADAFDRLVLQSPNSSMVWLRYMAFHLETAEIDKARAVAERALKTISFREEQEKLNVWVAYLNLENMYGTPQSLSEVLKHAVQQNDSIKVHQHLISIYISSGKMEEAEQVYNMLVKKHSQNKDIWISFEQFYFQNDRLESARRLLQRALKSLDPKQHVEVIAKVSQMEFKHGDAERGKTMFENILSNYPKRTDLWSVYIDMVTKQGNVENARHLYERVIGLKMSAKKMKFFFKKYLDFEQHHGTDATVAAVKQKALEFVESRGYIDTDD